MSQVRAWLFFEMFPRGNVGSLGPKKKYKFCISLPPLSKHIVLYLETKPTASTSQYDNCGGDVHLGNHSNGLSRLFHTNSNHVACGMWQVVTKYSMSLSHNIESI